MMHKDMIYVQLEEQTDTKDILCHIQAKLLVHAGHPLIGSCATVFQSALYLYFSEKAHFSAFIEASSVQDLESSTELAFHRQALFLVYVVQDAKYSMRCSKFVFNIG